MKLFIDTANIEEISLVSKLGVVCGVTTNPSLIAKEGLELSSVISEIATLIDGPISAEVNSLESDKMVTEALDLLDYLKSKSVNTSNIVIKIPMCEEGLKAINILSSKGIKTNATLIFTPSQALLCARAGATYVSPFVGRLDDISSDGINLISSISEMFNIHGIETEIISASIRHPEHVVQSALAGADIATVPYKVIVQMISHPLTTSGIEQFVKDFENSKKV